MNKAEARILHGLYYFREAVDEDFPVSPSEIHWLATTDLPGGRHRRGVDGKRQQKEIENNDWLARAAATSVAAERPLSFLRSAGYIAFSKSGDNWRVAVTAVGAERARELNSRWGRMNVFYWEHKDGLLWFLATVVVSSITALVTAYLRR
jgi:hypothetical protein